jgi:hypothetical protein
LDAIKARLASRQSSVRASAAVPSTHTAVASASQRFLRERLAVPP